MIVYKHWYLISIGLNLILPNLDINLNRLNIRMNLCNADEDPLTVPWYCNIKLDNNYTNQIECIDFMIANQRSNSDRLNITLKTSALQIGKIDI